MVFLYVLERVSDVQISFDSTALLAMVLYFERDLFWTAQENMHPSPSASQNEFAMAYGPLLYFHRKNPTQKGCVRESRHTTPWKAKQIAGRQTLEM